MKKKNTREQVVSSYFPTTEERHILGGYNFVGAGTRIYDRLSLKYDGKVGTKTYWLPKNKLDLAAVKHDLAYYIHDNANKINADIEFLKMAGKSGTAVVANSAIGTQLTARILNEIGFKAVSKSAVTIQSINEALLNLFTVPPYKGAGSIAGYLTNPTSGRLPAAIKIFLKTYFPRFRTRRGVNRITFTQNAFIRLYIVASTLYDLPDTIDNLNVLRKIEETQAKLAEDNPELENVFNKYKEYLDSVGSFDKHDEFIISKEGSITKYKVFFRAFQKYIKDVNRRNKTGPEYERPSLNAENINMVKLEDKDTDVIVPLETVEEFKMIDPDKVKKDPEEAKRRKEITSILKGDDADPIQNIWESLKSTRPTRRRPVPRTSKPADAERPSQTLPKVGDEPIQNVWDVMAP